MTTSKNSLKNQTNESEINKLDIFDLKISKPEFSRKYLEISKKFIEYVQDRIKNGTFKEVEKAVKFGKEHFEHLILLLDFYLAIKKYQDKLHDLSRN